MSGCPLKHSPIWIIGMTSDATLPSLLPQEAFTSWLECLMFPQLCVSIDSPKNVQNAQKEKNCTKHFKPVKEYNLASFVFWGKTEFTSERRECYTKPLNAAVIQRKFQTGTGKEDKNNNGAKWLQLFDEVAVTHYHNSRKCSVELGLACYYELHFWHKLPPRRAENFGSLKLLSLCDSASFDT